MNKYSQHITIFVIVFIATFTFGGCNKNDDPASVKTKNLLTSGVWKISKVTVDGVDKTDEFEGFTLQFTDDTFTSVHGNVVWPASDTWGFTDNTAKVFQRGDEVTVTIQTISSTKLVLALVWSKTTLGSGRSASISGDYVLEFTK